MESAVKKVSPQSVDQMGLVIPDLESDASSDNEQKSLNVSVDSEESTSSGMEGLGELRFADAD